MSVHSEDSYETLFARVADSPSPELPLIVHRYDETNFSRFDREAAMEFLVGLQGVYSGVLFTLEVDVAVSLSKSAKRLRLDLTQSLFPLLFSFS